MPCRVQDCLSSPAAAAAIMCSQANEIACRPHHVVGSRSANSHLTFVFYIDESVKKKRVSELQTCNFLNTTPQRKVCFPQPMLEHVFSANFIDRFMSNVTLRSLPFVQTLMHRALICTCMQTIGNNNFHTLPLGTRSLSLLVSPLLGA